MHVTPPHVPTSVVVLAELPGAPHAIAPEKLAPSVAAATSAYSAAQLPNQRPWTASQASAVVAK